MSTDPYGSAPPLVDLDELPNWIIAESEHWVVFDKPGWLVCHPSKQGPLSSLVGAAREYLQAERLHLVSRLDRETSGLVVLAKDPATASRLQTAVAQRRLRKRYLALLEGSLEEPVEVETRLQADDRSEVVIQQKVTFSRAGKVAHTRFNPLRVHPQVSLVEVEPVTGRKHQIRAHADWIGHAVIGDKIYGPDPSLYLEFIRNGWTQALGEKLPMRRQALHAAGLEFALAGENLAWEAPVPADMRECWCRLSGQDWE